jgi:hypothetical protein
MYIYNTQKNYNPLSHFRGLTKKIPDFIKKIFGIFCFISNNVIYLSYE